MIVSHQQPRRPHVVFVLADDLGWGDVGWNNPLMEDVTHRMTKIAETGVTLSQYYVQSICTPSRAALLTGKIFCIFFRIEHLLGMYPYHIGRQKRVLKPRHPTGLTLNQTLLSEKFKSLGYKTHIVGKWHLGFCNRKFTPTYRGFDSFYGFYNGAEDHLTHECKGGYDFRSNIEVDWAAKGHYSTDLLTEKSINIIKDHSKSASQTPLFLYLPYQAVHSPLQAPLSEYKTLKKTGNVQRDIYRAMLAGLDKESH